MNALHLLWILPTFAVVFAGFWAFVCLLLAVVGGWRRLAETYPQSGDPDGERLSGCSARIGLTSYNGVLSFHAGRECLHMAPMWMFRVGHPPLSIPWPEISATTVRGVFHRVELRVSRAPGVRILISARTADDLAKAAGGRLVVPE